MQTSRTPLALALLAALGGVTAVPAEALVISSGAVSFDNSASITDQEHGPSTSASDVNLGSSSIQQFDANTGVLMGATLNLASTRTQSTLVSSTDGPNNGNNNSVTSDGSGSSSARIVAPGVNSTFSTITVTGSCTGNRRESCSAPAITSSIDTNPTLSVADANLDAYVGVGTVQVSRTAPSLSVNQQSNAFTGTESTAYTLQWAGSLAATYDYLLHAATSFDGSAQFTLDLDFGDLYLGDTASDLAFSIFNAAGDRVGLDLDSILGSGDTTQFFTTLTTFTGLGAGSSNDYWASFVTSTLGSFTASYILGLSDADVGASSSRFNNYGLTLNLKGRVVEREPSILAPAPVPEPGALALFGLGLLGLTARRRKRR